MCYTYALFRHRCIGDQWVLCTGMSARTNRWGSSRWKHQLHVRVNHRFHLGDLRYMFWLTVLTGKRVSICSGWTEHCWLLNNMLLLHGSKSRLLQICLAKLLLKTFFFFRLLQIVLLIFFFPLRESGLFELVFFSDHNGMWGKLDVKTPTCWPSLVRQLSLYRPLNIYMNTAKLFCSQYTKILTHRAAYLLAFVNQKKSLYFAISVQ